MLLGIDVGGTYTDAVLIENGRVIDKAKTPTDARDLLTSLLKALDGIIHDRPGAALERIVLSTTLITNLIAEKKYDPVGLIIIPGPGLTLDSFPLPLTEPIVLDGAMDFRGREIIPLDQQQIKAAVEKLKARGLTKAAVVGKFSQRNKAHEVTVGDYLHQHYPDCQVQLGHQIAGQLNFPRRIATTLLTAAVQDYWQKFSGAVKEALAQRGLQVPVYILKADGGTLPLEQSLNHPVETIFSGPAASVLGVMALTPPGETSLMLDIGGTTTDLAIILSGHPLTAAKGAKIGEFLTQVRAFSVKAVPLGGDSLVRLEGGQLLIGPHRNGPAYCLGGPDPTPTDALRALNLIDFGDGDRALEAMADLGLQMGLEARKVAQQIIDKVAAQIIQAVKAMNTQWEQEPAYRVWEFRHRDKIKTHLVVGVGGGSQGLVPLVAEALGCEPMIPAYASVANAMGAAVAKPTLTVSLRIDTEKKVYSLYEEGIQETLEQVPQNQEEALVLARDWLVRRGRKLGFDLTGEGYDIIRNEVFNMIRDSYRVGKVYFISLQTPWGILDRIREGSEVLHE